MYAQFEFCRPLIPSRPSPHQASDCPLASLDDAVQPLGPAAWLALRGRARLSSDASEIKLLFSFRRVGADRESRAVLNVKNNMRASSDQSVQPYNSEAGELCMGIYLRALGGRALNEPQYPAPERVLPAGVFQTPRRWTGSPISKSLYCQRDT